MMRKKGMLLAACVMSVLTFAVTGLAGLRGIGKVESVETMEYTMERNELFYVKGSIVPDCKTLEDFVESISPGSYLTTIYVKDYDGLVLLVSNDGINHAGGCGYFKDTHIYVEDKKDGVRYLGKLVSEDLIGKSDGMIFARLHGVNGDIYERYAVTPNGKNMRYYGTADVTTANPKPIPLFKKPYKSY